MDTDVTAVREGPPTGFEAERDGPPTVAEGVDLLEAFTAAAHARHDAEVAVLQTLGRLVRAGVIESLEGLPVDVHLAVAHHFTAAERAMLLDATDVLAVMPATMRLWVGRAISWSQVRSLVAQVRRYGRDLRVALDDRIGASADLVELLDADRWEWTVADAIADLAGPDRTEREEAAADAESFVAVQMGLFGRSRIYAELDVPDTAAALAAMDARDVRHTRNARDVAERSSADAAGRSSADRPGGRRHRRRSLAKRRARALIGILTDSLDGHRRNGTTVKAKPLFIVHVPLDRITRSSAGLVDIAVPGWLPTLSGRLLDGLAADADIRAVVFDGARPLMVTRKLTAKAIPTDTRLACQARDMGARDPAGRTPLGLSDLHHLGTHTHHDHHDDHTNSDDDGGTDQAHHRTHDPDRMVHVSPRGHHRIIHRHGWTGTLDPTDGRLTWTRNGRTITTLPWHTTLNHP